jgi:hypothetical protein
VMFGDAQGEVLKRARQDRPRPSVAKRLWLERMSRSAE